MDFWTETRHVASYLLLKNERGETRTLTEEE